VRIFCASVSAARDQLFLLTLAFRLGTLVDGAKLALDL